MDAGEDLVQIFNGGDHGATHPGVHGSFRVVAVPATTARAIEPQVDRGHAACEIFQDRLVALRSIRMPVTLTYVPSVYAVADNPVPTCEWRHAGKAGRFVTGTPILSGIERRDGDAVIGFAGQGLVEIAIAQDALDEGSPRFVGGRRKCARQFKLVRTRPPASFALLCHPQNVTLVPRLILPGLWLTKYFAATRHALSSYTPTRYHPPTIRLMEDGARPINHPQGQARAEIPVAGNQRRSPMHARRAVFPMSVKTLNLLRMASYAKIAAGQCGRCVGPLL